jgi:hypothetical protein
MSVANKAQIVVVMGGSGSGKSTYIKNRIRKEKPKRLLIWDPMREYGELGRPVFNSADLAKAAKSKSFAVAFQPANVLLVKQFELLCKLAFEIGECWLVVEELNKVTKADGAPPNWSDCTSRGRHRGMTVIGASQRPAQVDKDFYSNATSIRTGRLNFEGDIKVLANALGVPGAEIKALPPLSYIERDMNTGAVSRGNITIR